MNHQGTKGTKKEASRAHCVRPQDFTKSEVLFFTIFSLGVLGVLRGSIIFYATMGVICNKNAKIL
ncbi:MAG: hypothetical protein AB1546_07785 [bacterium]